MKSIFVLLVTFLINSALLAQCLVDSPNELLDLIKKNHPDLVLNSSKGRALVNLIDIAEQRPNPELEADSTIGDSIEGDVYTTGASLKHTFELGGKRYSRIKVAQSTLATGMAMVNFRISSK